KNARQRDDVGRLGDRTEPLVGARDETVAGRQRRMRRAVGAGPVAVLAEEAEPPRYEEVAHAMIGRSSATNNVDFARSMKRRSSSSSAAPAARPSGVAVASASASASSHQSSATPSYASDPPRDAC